MRQDGGGWRRVRWRPGRASQMVRDRTDGRTDKPSSSTPKHLRLTRRDKPRRAISESRGRGPIFADAFADNAVTVATPAPDKKANPASCPASLLPLLLLFGAVEWDMSLYSLKRGFFFFTRRRLWIRSAKQMKNGGKNLRSGTVFSSVHGVLCNFYLLLIVFSRRSRRNECSEKKNAFVTIRIRDKTND